MPKISINEKDLSWYYRQRGAGSMTVYMPILSTFGPEEPTFCTQDNFADLFGSSAVKGLQDTSYYQAASFLTSGLNVLAHRILPEGASKSSSSTISIVWGDVALADDLTITVDNHTWTIPKGASEITGFVDEELAEKVLEEVKKTQTEAKLEYASAIADSASDTAPENDVIFSSIYAGSLGNSLVVKSYGSAGSSIRSLYIYLRGNLVERFIVDFEDTSSDQYYESVLKDSNYIEVTLKGTFDKSWLVNKETTLSGGQDYNSYMSAEDIKSGIIKVLEDASRYASLSDPYMYEFDVLTSGGYYDYANNTQISTIDQKLFDLATSSARAIFLIDGDPSWTAQQIYDYCGLFNSSYATCFGFWVYANYTATGTQALLPSSYAMLVQWGVSIASGNPEWMAPAGVKRAQVNTVSSVKGIVDSTVLNLWQNQEDTVDNMNIYKVNPIMRLRQYGYVIYGNSTLLKNNQGRTSVLQMFSVRVLANLIKKKAFDISLTLQFDQLTDDLFAQFKTLLSSYLDTFRYQGALYDYRIVIDRSVLVSTSMNEKRVPVTIMISPIPAVENFDITLEIHQSGITFTED